MGEQNFPIAGLSDLISQHASEGMVVCEVGVYHGHSLKSYLPIVRKHNGRIIAVDWFKGNVSTNYHFGGTPGAYSGDKDYEDKFWDIVGKENSDIVTVMKMDSMEALQQLADSSVDFMFLDADHRFSSVNAEIIEGKRIVKKGGILAGHDCESKVTPQYQTVLESQQVGMSSNSASIATHSEHLSIFEFDCWGGYHHGTIKAVNEHFGTDFEMFSSHVWYKTI